MSRVVLLGPQRLEPTLAPTLDSLECGEPLVVVTAGWQEREGETEELQRHVARELLNLRLYERAEEVKSRDPELATALRERQERLQEVQALYRRRLRLALEAARDLLGRSGGGRFLEQHRRAAIRAIRTLDRQHVVQARSIHAEFDARWSPTRRDAVRRQLEPIAELIARCAAVAVAGGHVAVLYNRLRLFGFASTALPVPLIAWSAGAMALAERIVLFHDSPPQGPGDAEILEEGLGRFAGVVPLPHAAQRLRLADSLRVALMARRFAPTLCVPLEPGTRIDREGDHWVPRSGARVLGRRGGLRAMAAK